ncbi:MAG: ABC transporter ATP-binding protein [Spirochaetes bacterium]|nr:ABC transporter ATP-binding protein [Spirochaetota bacterium]MBN2770519.1 ABC transporter ATP-binding protein [Spirochaetota bacterium]
MSNVIEISELEKIYGIGRNALHVLNGIDLEIKHGEIVSVVGSSGAGKSTLLHCIGCLDTFQKGSLKINGKELSGFNVEELSGFRNRTMGFIFQSNNLLTEFTALENVMIPLLIRRVSRKKAKLAALDVIDRFGLGERINHKPSEMSGGECQRIAVARAIVGKPTLILADEPTGSLDSKNSEHLIDILFELGRENGTTIVIVSHDPLIAEKTGRTIHIKDGKIC